MPLLYCMTEVRLITFKSLILARFDSSSSWMPSAKKAFSFSSLRFSKGRTAILFSGIAAACDWGGFVTTATGLFCGLIFQNYNLAGVKIIRPASPQPTSIFRLDFWQGTVVVALV